MSQHDVYRWEDYGIDWCSPMYKGYDGTRIVSVLRDKRASLEDKLKEVERYTDEWVSSKYGATCKDGTINERIKAVKAAAEAVKDYTAGTDYVFAALVDVMILRCF